MKLHQPESQMQLPNTAETARIGTSVKNKPIDNPAPCTQSARSQQLLAPPTPQKNTGSSRAPTTMTIVDAGMQRPALTLQRR